MSIYSPPDAHLLDASSQVLSVCRYLGDTNLRIIPVKSISTCVAMIPFKKPADDRYFVCEKMGLEVAILGEAEQEQEEAKEQEDADDWLYV